jgi:hypothetical protein
MRIHLKKMLPAGAAALLLAGCMAPGSTGTQPQQPTADSPPAAAAKEAPPKESKSATKSGEKSTDQTGTKANDKKSKAEQEAPKTPKEALMAEEKNLTAAETEFVTAMNEPETYAGAVLEAGREVCDRLEYLSKVDPGILPAVLASGDIPNAEEAAAHLCPEFTPQLMEGNGGFGDGKVSVSDKAVAGKSMKPGVYTAVSPAGSCNWRVVDKNGKLLAEGGIEYGDAAEVKVTAEAALVTSANCYAWIPVK